MISGTARELIRLWITTASRPAARSFGDLARGHQGRDGARAHRVAPLVDDEAPVGVAVEGQADVGAVLDDGPLQVDQVGRVERVGLMVGEAAVELEVQRDDPQRQCRQPGRLLEHGRHGEPAHAVAGVDYDGQLAGTAQVDQPAQVGRVVGEQVLLGDRAGRLDRGVPGVRALLPGSEVLLGQLAHLGQPGVLTDRPRAGPAELDPVVLRRVVARREHRTGGVQDAGGVVQAVGGAQPDQDDVTAGRRDAFGESAGQCW
jgi:hypothetical protein